MKIKTKNLCLSNFNLASCPNKGFYPFLSLSLSLSHSHVNFISNIYLAFSRGKIVWNNPPPLPKKKILYFKIKEFQLSKNMCFF